MSRPFSHNSAKASFSQVKEPVQASVYTQTKKLNIHFVNQIYVIQIKI